MIFQKSIWKIRTSCEFLILRFTIAFVFHHTWQVGTITFPRLGHLNVLIRLGLGQYLWCISLHLAFSHLCAFAHTLSSARDLIPFRTLAPHTYCHPQQAEVLAFTGQIWHQHPFPGNLPRCPMDVPCQPCTCIFLPCAMMVGGWDCLG